MFYREIFRFLGKYLYYFSLMLILPFCVSIYYEYISPTPHPTSAWEFFETFVICVLLAEMFRIFGRKAKGVLQRRESILLVVLIWIITAGVSALPFYLTKTLSNPVDAYFEAMSGLTTTGASMMSPKAFDADGREIPVVETNVHVPEKVYSYMGTITPLRNAKGEIIKTGVEAVSRGVLFWRSFLQWLGGMGIVVLFLAILPAIAVGGKFLFQMEVPGPTKEAITPRIKDTSSILWKLYLGISILQIYLLIWTNEQMPLFDAFCITFSTISTGGFSVRNASIGAYNNPYTEWIVIIFMVIGAINFALYFHLIRRKFSRIYEPDFLFFLGTTLVGALLVSLFLIGAPHFSGEQSYNFSQSIRAGFFQAISAQTSTGFFTQDYDNWPFAPQLFMLLLMFVGGMSGSTAGGIKTSRFYILYKIVTHKVEAIFRPEAVRKLKIGDKVIDNNTALTVMTFFCITMFFAILGTVILVIAGIDPETSLGAIACMMNNVGMAFRASGPIDSFVFFPDIAKVVSIIWMLLGRLEFFTVLLLFVPGFWRLN